jgi:hypothetical protein
MTRASANEMIDRAARAIRSANDPETAALAVLRELRVPSPEMLEAASNLPKTAGASDVWEAMITAAASTELFE